MAGLLTVRNAGSGAAGASVGEVTRTLIACRRALVRNAPGGSAMVVTGITLGWCAAWATLLLGLVPFDEVSRLVDLQAMLGLGWLLGWIMGPIAFRGGGQGLRPEYFALLPVRPRRLAAGLLGASFVGHSPVITLVAFLALPLAAFQLGAVAAVVAVPAVLLQLIMVLLVSKVCVAAVSVVLNSRRGKDIGGLLMAAIIALASGGWALVAIMSQQLEEGPSPVLRAALRVLPSGWASVAVAAAEASDWLLASGALLALAALSGLLLLAWAWLLERNVRLPGGQAPRASRRRSAAVGMAGERPAGGRLLVGPTGAVVRKELSIWRRDPGRSLGLLIGLLISVMNLGVPAVAYREESWAQGFDTMVALPLVGLIAVVVTSMTAVNVYGNDGTAFWLTRMLPGTERADVRGRQAAWLLVTGGVLGVLTVGLTALGGQGWAWPLVAATLPAMLGGVAGLMVALSAAAPVKQKEPHLRTNEFDTGDDPNAGGAVLGQGWLMGLAAATVATPGAALVVLGGMRDAPALQLAGVALGIAVGAGLYWWGGRFAARRLADRGAEIMDLLHMGPAAGGGVGDKPEVTLPRGKSVAVNSLWLAAALCVFPQGLVPLLFNVLDVDPETRVWFLARYMPTAWQVPVAVGFMVLGALAGWWARSISRRAASETAARSA